MITSVLTTRQDKARGLLFGLMLGDALGSPFAGRAEVSEADLAAEEAAPSNLVLTGDALLALTLTDHLVRLGSPDSALLAAEMAVMWKSRPLRGYPDAVMMAFRPGSETVACTDVGVAKRVTPVALVGKDLRHTTELASRAAAVTRPDDESERDAIVQACAAFLALHSPLDCPLDPVRFTADLTAAVECPVWQGRLAVVNDLVEADATPGETVNVDMVSRALVAFLINPDDPDSAIHHAIRCGGDTGTVAGMAGALAGARGGTSIMSRPLLCRLEGRRHATRLADDLVSG